MFEGEFAEPFATVCVCCGMGCDASAAEFGTCSILSVVSGYDSIKERSENVVIYLVVHGESR